MQQQSTSALPDSYIIASSCSRLGHPPHPNPSPYIIFTTILYYPNTYTCPPIILYLHHIVLNLHTNLCSLTVHVGIPAYYTVAVYGRTPVQLLSTPFPLFLLNSPKAFNLIFFLLAFLLVNSGRLIINTTSMVEILVTRIKTLGIRFTSLYGVRTCSFLGRKVEFLYRCFIEF